MPRFRFQSRFWQLVYAINCEAVWGAVPAKDFSEPLKLNDAMTNNNLSVNPKISPEEVVKAHQMVFQEDWKARKFRDSSWSVERLDTCLRLTGSDFEKIKRLCEQWGDKSIIITDIEPIPSHQFTMVVTPDVKEIDRASRTLLGHFEAHVFGLSKKWGLICTLESGSYLGQP